MEAALITAGTGLLLFALGFLTKTITGEQRATVRKADGEASKAYSEAIANTVRTMVELQLRVDKLSERVDLLERENDSLRNKVTILERENTELRRSMNG